MNSQKHKIPSFNEVIEEYYDIIFRYVLKQVNQIEDAKDLTQEIFIKTYNNYGKFDPNRASIKTWIFQIATNHIINYWKSSHYRHRSSIEINIESLSTNDRVLERIIQEEDVRYILHLMEKTLNKKHFKIMTLYFFSNLEKYEIAETLKIRPKTVSNVISLSIKSNSKHTKGCFRKKRQILI